MGQVAGTVLAASKQQAKQGHSVSEKGEPFSFGRHLHVLQLVRILEEGLAVESDRARLVGVVDTFRLAKHTKR